MSCMSKSSFVNHDSASGNVKLCASSKNLISLSRSGMPFLLLSSATKSGHNSITFRLYSALRQTGQKSEPSMFWKCRCFNFFSGRKPSKSWIRDIGLARSFNLSSISTPPKFSTFEILLEDKSRDTSCESPSKFSMRMIWLFDRSSHRKLMHKLTASIFGMDLFVRMAWNILSSSNSPVSCLMYSRDRLGMGNRNAPQAGTNR
mmetsp:Transcript_106633/g.340262  ORF Transcript_106633/g.340262 Transcript_106633/m.340262 type:complete len:203 (-) Transcript_106633:68-676(-)